MATVKGTNYTKYDSPTPSTLIDAAQWGGRVRWMSDVYECSSTAQGTQIKMGRLPRGAHVLPESKLYHDALGGSSELAIGITGDLTMFSAKEDTSSAGNIEFDSIDDFGTAMTADTDLIVTVSGSGAATGTIRLSLLYAYK